MEAENETGGAGLLRKVLVRACAYESLMSDLHYRARDEWFYALHALSDRQGEFRWQADALKEVYWLGWLNGLPPEETSLKADVVEYVKGLGFAGRDTNRDLVQAVSAVATDGIDAIETAKGVAGLPGGVHAVLDEMSKQFLVARGLCWRTLTHGGTIGGKPEDGSGEQLAKYLEVMAVE